MDIYESGEDYLEAILMLQKRTGSVRSIDIATQMGYSKPTISIAMRRLRESGYVEYDEHKDIILTQRGREVAERMYERHVFLTDVLKKLGVDEEEAVKEACKIEHDISADSFEKIKAFFKNADGSDAGSAGLEGMLKRRSIRKYKPQQIEDSLLDAVLQVGTYAPTAMGRQSPLILVLQSPEDVAAVSRLNAAAAGVHSDTFYGAPTVITVFADRESSDGIQDACLVMGNLLNASYFAGLGSCWINRAREVFDSEEGRALKKKWGIADKWVGVGHCILGYADESPAPRPRKEGYVIKIK